MPPARARVYKNARRRYNAPVRPANEERAILAKADSRPTILTAVFFLSGAAALVFETLWFRQAGLTFGNSVWASALVLSSFMAGLALGNALAGRLRARIRRPVRCYALLELSIAAGGVALVYLLPLFSVWLAPLLRPFLERPWVLNPLRLAAAFVLLALPATAMGATLPVLVKALGEERASFGAVLGRLYGWNTLGAVVGALAGEGLLIGRFGVRGTSLVAAGLCATAALAAFALAGRDAGDVAERPAAPPPARARRPSPRAWRIAAAAFASGAILLAFEVVWLRFLQLFIEPTGLAFSLVLAAVLAGIGSGGALAGAWLRRHPAARLLAPACACAAGALAVATYAGFRSVVAPYGTGYVVAARDVLWLSAALCFPVSAVSGVLFTLTAASLRQHVEPGIRAAALATLANTVGAGLGSLAAGFALLPALGMERSFLLLAGLYGVVALLLFERSGSKLASRLVAAGAVVLAAALVLFPSGLMVRGYLAQSLRRFDVPDRWSVVALREGRGETVAVLREREFGRLHSLITNGFSVASNAATGRRYMKLFVYWPLALDPAAEDALLISYGVGSTAKALTDTPGLEHIDVVDISRDILELSEVVYPDPRGNPLHDPRVEVHVEDGRYFLQTTERRYDLITGEPPPPLHAGVDSLYTREYFRLIHDRLAEGGINTYWLPTHLLEVAGAKAIIRAYCEVFEDCSLWTGASWSWMLAGSRNGAPRPSEEAFARQWRDPRVAAELSALGLERPELLGATFIADAARLRELTADSPPLTDDFPKRLGASPTLDTERDELRAWMDVGETRRRFRDSAFVSAVWPAGLRQRTLEAFAEQATLNSILIDGAGPDFPRLDRTLTRSASRSLALWDLGLIDVWPAVERLPAERAGDPRYLGIRGGGALAAHRFDRAAELYRSARAADPGRPLFWKLELYALCMAGRLDEARETLRLAADAPGATRVDRPFAAWLAGRFGLDLSAMLGQ